MVKVTKIALKKKNIESVLSPLESDVIRILWKLEKARVREVHKLVKRRRQVALSSVAVILDRLHKREIVIREIEKGLGGGHYIYYPKTTKEGFERSIVDNTVNKLINNFGDVAVNYFHKRFSKRK